jgi:hypothetical protein
MSAQKPLSALTFSGLILLKYTLNTPQIETYLLFCAAILPAPCPYGETNPRISAINAAILRIICKAYIPLPDFITRF